MRALLAVLVALAGLGIGSLSPTFAQTTPGSCPAGSTTTISGVVYAPNGIDPLPNVLVYIPGGPVDAFVPGVSCPVVGQPPSGSPVAGATTAVDGSFTIDNAPSGTNIPLVIISGRWRRQFVIPAVTSCAANPLPSAPLAAGVMPFVSFPSDHTQGDIPRIAVATGAVDAVECVLRKVGISDPEFNNPGGSGRIDIYKGDFSPGAHIDNATPAESTLMSNLTTLNTYDVLMLPCEGGPFTRPGVELSNLVSFANAGGRVYSSHFAYSWMYQNPPFNKVVNWLGSSGATFADNTFATVNASFSGGATLSTWLQDVGASTIPGQIPLQQIKHDFNGVNPPTESWLTLNVTGNPVMQFVFDAPVGQTTNQCGRVLYNEYHVETPVGGTGIFPAECSASSKMTPQEKLLEYSLFELTNDGGAATLSPTTQDFGTQAVGFTSPVQTFTWTNNSTFPASVTLLTGSGDFGITSSNCTLVPAYGTCQIKMAFTPTVLGPRTGTLTVGSSGTTLTAALTGTGVPGLTIALTALNFGNLDVGATLTQSVAVQNTASGPLPVPPVITTGDYTASIGNCGSTLAAGASCTIVVTFKPTAPGSRPGTLAVQSASAGPPATLSGNGVDFTIAAAPASGTVIAGYNTATVVTTTPLAGFNANVRLTCTTNAPASLCTLAASSFAPAAPVASAVTITTTSQYTVIGYGALGGTGWLSLVAAAAGFVLCLRRRAAGPLARRTLTLLFLAAVLGAGSVALSGCSGLLPARNPSYTPATGTAGTTAAAGPYVYTVTATDGFLVHAATYQLTVTSK